MNSATLPSFWENYRNLDRNTRIQARKAYRLWSENQFHPSLRFKCINREENIWSVRLSSGYRALGILDEETITWFWVGNHDDYEKFFG
ncbi:MAG TPA: hypothetical protein PLK28_14480 [Candidatus Rifleibacterium sp.]|jgi:hypothetical protein|nr:hypothetical protein [Candidatus Rifleibacterium sp.]HOI91705.1 hypothetical protein [Candidatus Rifleibacterium sp.]